ncbi:HAD family hydrolase [Methylobacterium sp. ID0610]|uniref:HAD family hydrolase n=1 Tax=Methylobacterium carpenticola TaxID=3344827 RepID=UPI0036A094E3
MKRSIDLIIFDCDGVLVDSEPLAAAAMAEVLGRAGHAVPPSIILRSVGRKQDDIIRDVEGFLGSPVAPAALADLWPATRAAFRGRLQPTSGITAFLRELRTARCVASSSSHQRIAFSLAETGLAEFCPPEVVFSGHDVARGKPAPDLFLHAAACMGVAPERCLVIEDSRYGVQGAVAAGALAVGYTGGSHAPDAAALRAAGATWAAGSWTDMARQLAEYELGSPRGNAGA